MIDLPLRGGEPAPSPGATRPSPPPRRPSRAGARPAAPPPERRPPASEAATSVRRHRPPRRWPVVAVLLVAFLVAAAVFFWTRPILQPSEERLDFGELRLERPEKTLRVALTNTGRRAMDLTTIAVAGEAAADFGVVTESCSSGIRGSGESCEVEVRFLPRATGERRATLELDGNARGSVALVGTGIAPRVAATPAALDFGTQQVEGREAGLDLALTNEGSAPLELEKMLVDGAAADDFRLVGRCGRSTLEVGESCELRLAFAPRATGERRAELRIDSDDPAGSFLVALSGTGSWEGPATSADPETLDFGGQKVGVRSAPRRVRLTNRAAAPTAIGQVVSDTRRFAVEGTDCLERTLAPADSCTVDVSFTPSEQGGASGSLEVRPAAGGAPTRVGLRGSGTVPRLEIAASELDFGGTRVGFESAAKSLELRNTGAAPLAVRRLMVSGDAFELRADDCTGKTIEPRGRCRVQVVFRPDARGRRQGTLRIGSDAPQGETAVALLGEGTAPEIGADASRLDFGTVRRPEGAAQRLRLTNTGTATLQIRSTRITGSAAQDFQVSRVDCREEGLAPGASCTVTVEFRPRSDGRLTAALAVEHNAPSTPLEVALSGDAEPPVPGFRLSARTLEFPSLDLGARSDVRTLTIENPGVGRLVLGGISLTGAHAEDFRVVPGTCEGAPFVAPGGNCTVGVRFMPREGGQRRATLRVRHNAPGGEATVGLRGVGIAPPPPEPEPGPPPESG